MGAGKKVTLLYSLTPMHIEIAHIVAISPLTPF